MNFVWDGDCTSIQTVFDLHSKGEKVLCPTCGAELIIVLSQEEKQKYKRNAGMYCSADESHLRIGFNLAQDRLDFHSSENKNNEDFVNDEDLREAIDKFKKSLKLLDESCRVLDKAQMLPNEYRHLWTEVINLPDFAEVMDKYLTEQLQAIESKYPFLEFVNLNSKEGK